MVDSTKSIQDALALLGGGARVASSKAPLQVIPTDLAVINDIVFGCGGIPRSKVIEIYSKPSVGKSSLFYWLVGQVQKRKGAAALFDGEGSYYPAYGEACGIINNELILPDFTFGEDALYQIKLLLAMDLLDLIGVDSMPALQPFSASEATSDPKSMNQNLARAKMFTGFFNDIMGGFEIKGPNGKKVKSSKRYVIDGESYDTIHKIHDKKASLIMINHAKDKVGVMYGERTYTPGGDSINFASSIRIGMSYIGKSKKKGDDGQPLFREVSIKAVKNKLAPPYNETVIRLWRKGGITADDSTMVDEVEQVDEDKEESVLKGIQRLFDASTSQAAT